MGADQIEPASIDSSHVSAGIINDSQLLSNDVINSQHYVDASIDEQHLNIGGASAINDTVLVYDSSQSGNMGWRQLTGSSIQDGVISSAKLESDAVTTAKIADEAVTADKISAQVKRNLFFLTHNFNGDIGTSFTYLPIGDQAEAFSSSGLTFFAPGANCTLHKLSIGTETISYTHTMTVRFYRRSSSSTLTLVETETISIASTDDYKVKTVNFS